jgi:hypothetical protein
MSVRGDDRRTGVPTTAGPVGGRGLVVPGGGQRSGQHDPLLTRGESWISASSRHRLMPLPSAFISYAHEDQEFMLALAEALRAGGLDVRFDTVVLRVGDSLIDTLSREITEGDFLIALLSPDAVVSGWCRTELEIAMTQGIADKRVKVLPVRYRHAEMPVFLQGRYWADVDRHGGLGGVARMLLDAIESQLAGRDPELPPAQTEGGGGEDDVEDATTASERATTALLDSFDAMVERVMDLLLQWDACLEGDPSYPLADKQRRLRYSLGYLPERVVSALPIVGRLANADWDGYFREVRPAEVEPDLQEELRSVRAQLAQNLPVTRRWVIQETYARVNAGSSDAIAFQWTISRGEETRPIVVYISGTVMASDDEHLPRDVVDAKQSHGRSALLTLLPLDNLPSELMVHTAGIRYGPFDD